MRAALLAGVFALGFAATPARSAAASTEVTNEDVATYGRWVATAIEANVQIQQEFQRISPQLSQIMQRMRAGGDAKAGSAELAAVVRSVQPVVRRSQATLQALAPLPNDTKYPIPTKQLKADLLSTGNRMIGLLDSMVAMGEAIAAGDRATADREAAAMKSGATLLIDGQIAIVRARRAMVPADESTHQALGLMDVLYQAMALTLRQRIEPGPWPRERFGQLAAQAETLAARGRTTLTTELKDVDQTVALTDSDRRVLAAAKTVTVLDNQTFAIGDTLARTLKTAAAGSATAGPATMRELVALEVEFHGVTRKQADAMAGAE